MGNRSETSTLGFPTNTGHTVAQEAHSASQAQPTHVLADDLPKLLGKLTIATCRTEQDDRSPEKMTPRTEEIRETTSPPQHTQEYILGNRISSRTRKGESLPNQRKEIE